MTTTIDKTAEKPLFRVLKGNPDGAELAALTAVLTALAARRSILAADATGERNMWGRPEERLQRATLYNPNAFRNVTFY